MGHPGQKHPRGNWWVPLGISAVINLSLIVVVLKIGVFPKIRLSEDTGIQVSLENFLTPESPAPPPPKMILPSFGMADVASPSENKMRNLTEETAGFNPPSLKIIPPTQTVDPPRPILSTSQFQKNDVAKFTPEPSKQSRTENSKGTLSNGNQKQGSKETLGDPKRMIGDLLIPEEKLMAIMPNLRIPGPARVLVPSSYKTAIINRAKNRLFEARIPSHGYALDDEFVSAVIEFAEKCQPEAIYWLHWTLYGEHPPARTRLEEWLKQSGIPLYVSSWDVPLSPSLQETVLNSGGSYEQRNTYNRPTMKIRTTPSGTNYIREELKKNNQWSPSMQSEEDVWEAIVISTSPKLKSVDGVEATIPEATKVSVSIINSSRGIDLSKNHFDQNSWNEVISNLRKKSGTDFPTSPTVMILSKNGDTTILMKKDSVTGDWEKLPDPRPEDLITE